MADRDDLENGGAGITPATVGKVHELSLECSVEVFSSDLMGGDSAPAIRYWPGRRELLSG